MTQQYNFYNIEASFISFLSSGNKKLKPISIKNYVSDLRFFLGWLISTTQSVKENRPNDPIELFQRFFNQETLDSYLGYLESNTSPVGTKNRRLSSLKKFFEFARTQDWIAFNPLKHSGASREALTQSKLLDEFRKYLNDSDELNDSEKKRYIQDVTEFLGSSI